MRVLRATWLAGCLLAALQVAASAQVVRDGSLGAGQGQVVPGGVDPAERRGGRADYLITPDLGVQRGANLFHSFQHFVVGELEIAQFTNHGNPGLENIVVRVTAGEGTQIGGLLRSSIEGADLYLLDPRGVEIVSTGGIDSNFRPGGFQSFSDASVFLSTADALAFEDGGLGSMQSFSASGSDPAFSSPGCCAGSPSEFVFEGNPRGDSSELARVGVASKDITLLGGGSGTGVDLGQRFVLVGEQVKVTASQVTAFGGVVGLAAVGDAAVRVPVDLSLSSADGSPWVEALGEGATLEIASKLKTRDPRTEGARLGGGRVVLRGGGLILDAAEIDSDGVGSAGIDIYGANTIRVMPGSSLDDSSLDPAAGGIRIEGGSLHVDDGAEILSDAGDIFVAMAGDVRLLGEANIGSESEGAANAGDIELRSGSRIHLRGFGNALPDIRTRGRLGSRGAIGKVTLDAPKIEILGGAAVSASTQGSGDAGDVVVSGGTLWIAGTNETGDQSSAVFAESVKATDVGDAGTVRINLHDLLLLEERGQISVRSRGAGTAGNVIVNVEAGSLRLESHASINASSAVDQVGRAGDVDIDVAVDVTLVDSEIRTSSLDTGGGVAIDAGGNVEMIRSQLLTDVRGEGTGGDVLIGQGGGVPRLVLLASGEIVATAVKGFGGNIEIAAEGFLASADSVVDATSMLGIDGVVDVNAPVVQVEGRLDPLPASYLDVSALLRDHCAARRSAGASSFTLQGRPSLPPEPDDLLPSSLPSVEGARTALRRLPNALLPLRSQLGVFDPSCGDASRAVTTGG